jgi:serine/threonine-protein kinase
MLGLLFGFLFTFMAIFPPQNVASGLIRVPDVVGRPAEEAQRAVERAGLTYEEEAGFHHQASPGIVVAQEPLAGQVAGPGSPVDVTVSLGPKLHPVPDVVGLRHRQAEEALGRVGYASEVIWVDADADVGRVVGTRPEPGTPVELPSTVRLIVSAGPKTVNVPDLATSSLDEAQATLERLGLELGGVARDSSSLAAPNTVLSQSPEPGEVVDRGTPVSVIVATVPAVQSGDSIGLPRDTATAALDTTTQPNDTTAEVGDGRGQR